MDGRRDGPGHPRWTAPRPPAPSDKPVSSYASLACGPPPSYARQGDSGSWEYDDKPQRPPSPVGRTLGAPYYPSRGGGGRSGGGRYDGDRMGGGRGRSIRGGRERNDRMDRFSGAGGGGGGGQHRNSPDRFQNSNMERSSGYEAGEILPSQRLGSSPGPNQRRLDERSYEGRGSMDGRGSGRFIPRGGGGRDAGRTGRGGPRSFGAGRFVERGGGVGGRGGRSDFRSRKMGDGRDMYNNNGGNDWAASGGGRTTPDEPGRVIGGLEKPRNDDGHRFYPNEPKGEPMHQRGDDRNNQQGRPYEGNSRDPAVGRGPGRYSSLAANPDAPPPRKLDPRPDDRFVKRRRDDEDYFDDKRSRNNEYVPRSRPLPNEDGRFAPGPPHRPPDDGPGGFDSRSAPRPGDMRERRGLDARGPLDRPPIRSEVAMPSVPLNHDDRRPRPAMDDRARPGGMNDGPYDQDPSLRGNRRPGAPPQNTDLRLDRNDNRGMPLPIRGDVSRRFVPARDDSRLPGPPSGLRDEPHPGPPPPRHMGRPDMPETRERDQRIPLPRDPREPPLPGPPQRFDGRDGNINQDRGAPQRFDAREGNINQDRGADRYEVPPPPDRMPPRGDMDGRPPLTAPLDRGRDMREMDFRGRQTEMGHGDNRSLGMVSGRLDVSRNAPPNPPLRGDGWTPHSQHPPQQHNMYDGPPHVGNRGNWNASQPINRSPMPSPNIVRGTIPPPVLDQNLPIADPSVGPAPLPFAGRGPPENRDFMAGRGRGRGFRGMGRGRPDFGRFPAGGGRGPTEYNHGFGPSGQDAPLQSREVWKRYPGPVQDGDKSLAPETGTKVDESESAMNQQDARTTNEKPGSVAKEAGQSGSGASESNSAPSNPTTDVKKEEKPRAISPPPKGEPSGVMKALVRLIDLEASMEYAYAKHMQLVKKQKELKAQAVILADLPVGIESFKEDLEAVEANQSIYGIE